MVLDLRSGLTSRLRVGSRHCDEGRLAMFDFDDLDAAELRLHTGAGDSPGGPGEGDAAHDRRQREEQQQEPQPGDALGPQELHTSVPAQSPEPAHEPDTTPPSSQQHPQQPPEVLDEERWRKVVREPSQTLVARWVRSESVREILRQFVLEDIVGGAEVIQFRDVYKLLGTVGVSQFLLVAKFVDVPDGDASRVKRLADQVLSRFACASVRGTFAMRFVDLFRLFEVLDISIRKLLSSFVDDVSEWDFDGPQFTAPRWRLGEYLVSKEIGSGFHGPCIYLAEHVYTKRPAALKWPVCREELRAMQALSKLTDARPGLPRLLASGIFEGELFAVTDLLGSPLSRMFERLQDHPCDQRWAALRIIGRLMVRRLQAVHEAGFIHCDVSPENFLIGRSRLTSVDASKDTLYLIDFGLACLSTPDGRKLDGWQGSNEWSSIRSADGGRRLPADDLEAVGWVLLHGMFGELPWYSRLAQAYAEWGDANLREVAVRAAQQEKLALVDGGFDSYSGAWRNLADTPAELQRYLKVCRTWSIGEDITSGSGRFVELREYDELCALLGAPAGPLLHGAVDEASDGAASAAAASSFAGAAARSWREVEEDDLHEYQAMVVPLLR